MEIEEELWNRKFAGWSEMSEKAEKGVRRDKKHPVPLPAVGSG